MQRFANSSLRSFPSIVSTAHNFTRDQRVRIKRCFFFFTAGPTKTSTMTYHFFPSMENKCGPILSVEQETIVGNVNSASSRDYNYGAIMRINRV